MQILKGIIIIAIFFAGYFTHSVITKEQAVAATITKPSFSYNDTRTEANPKKAIISSGVPVQQKTTSFSDPTTENTKLAQSLPAKKELTPTDKDHHDTSDPSNSSPKPYDDMREKVDGTLRERYKDFAAAEHTDDWDVRTQSKITDFILSRPAATDIKIDSVHCNSNICEIRLEENKRFLLMATFAELLQESWLVNEATGQFSFNDKFGYMLLMRKE